MVSKEVMLDWLFELFDKLDDVNTMVGLVFAVDKVVADLTPEETTLAFEFRALLKEAAKTWFAMLLRVWSLKFCSALSGTTEDVIVEKTFGFSSSDSTTVEVVLVDVTVEVDVGQQESRPSSRIISASSFSVSLDKTVIKVCACLVASAEPRIMTIRSPWPFCFSTSIWAPETSRIVLMLHPPRPITRLMAFDGTRTFFDLRTTSFQPSSLLPKAVDAAWVELPAPAASCFFAFLRDDLLTVVNAGSFQLESSWNESKSL